MNSVKSHALHSSARQCAVNSLILSRDADCMSSLSRYTMHDVSYAAPVVILHCDR